MEVRNIDLNLSNRSQEWRSKVITGALPSDFLRVTNDSQSMPSQPAIVTQPQINYYSPATYFPPMPACGTIKITVAQAKLVKNYGYTRMDPYCKIRIGHNILETPTDTNGSKSPRWNKTFTFPLPPGVDSMYLEIYSERSIVSDDRIAWLHLTIPEALLNGETVEDWYSLSGKQGEDKEGMINLIMSYSPPPTEQVPIYPASNPSHLGDINQYYAGDQSQDTKASIETLKGMFPGIDEEVIQSVLASSGWNVNAAINNLLSMNP